MTAIGNRDPVTLTVTAVTQDEPINGLGDGDVAPDAQLGPASNQVQLRAERAGTGDGRIYRAAVAAKDPHGASCTAVATVGVAHDQKAPPFDSGGSSTRSRPDMRLATVKAIAVQEVDSAAT